MEIVDSFVHDVAHYLPKEQRESITADLQASIYEELEARADAEDRAPTEEDAIAVLRGFGHPLKVAGQYLPERYLIGPNLYPVYFATLRVFMTVAIVGFVIAGLVLGFFSDWKIGPISFFWSSLEIIIWVAVIVTGVFIAVEFGGQKFNWYESWDPRDSVNTVGVIDRGDVITNLLSEGFFLLWWNDVIVLQNFLPDGAFALQLADIWGTYFWHLNVLFAAAFLLHGYVLARGVWKHKMIIAETVLFSAMVGLGLVLATADTLVIVETTAVPGLSVEGINTVVRATLWVIIGFTLWDIYNGFRLWRGARLPRPRHIEDTPAA